ncbi:hypothetical protein AVEN_169501-1 [Araneus ventricosus]|uniref:Helitron helicase-like domain-containing protein n=1 Tax=Araneus ventricosus TaxID=182803 RepID=A0A4Y2THY2_ARAVE|nr:hypothetical protein AVEN_169501-1 [Araneus ventricosus]
MSPELKVVIYADKTPSGQHERRYNAPETSEVAIILAGDKQGSRDISLELRSNQIKKIAETHRAYDALQYPLLFWQGEDGYNFELRQTNPTGEITKKISSHGFYAFRFMFRTTNLISFLRCKELFHQFVVDMYAKIESERLRFIRLNQKKLRVEDYAFMLNFLCKICFNKLLIETKFT